MDHVSVRVAQACTAQELCVRLGFSRRVMQRVFSQGQLTCGKRVLGRDDALAAGTEVCVRLAATHAVGRTSDKPVAVLWQDRIALAVDKPAGILVHDDGTGVETLTARVRGLTGLPAQAVQRLDKETSGVVLFSLAEEFQPFLDAQVAGHDMHKRYVAVVRGRLSPGTRTIDAPLARDRHDARRMRVGRTGKAATTRVAPVVCHGNTTLVACELLTGRKHQIRVHLAYLGHPVVGDALYGAPAARGGLMLHAMEESFVHPATGERIVLQTRWPRRFSKLFSPRVVDWSILEP